MTDQRIERKAVWVRAWQQVPVIVALIALWMLLWGNVTWLNLVTGLVLALIVTRVFYLPPVDLSGRFHPWWVLVFLAHFVWKLVVASFQVAAQAFAPRPFVPNAVIGVQLFTRSDIIMTLTALTLSLIPGSLVVEADRGRSILYLHVLRTPDLDAVESARTQVMRIERRLVRAIGSRQDLERMREWT
jgi:multicomponent Na+:H+ antiporter subunit E